MKLAIQNRGDDCAGNDARGGDADDHFGVVRTRYLECQTSRELAEEGPFHFDHALGLIDLRATRRHARNLRVDRLLCHVAPVLSFAHGAPSEESRDSTPPALPFTPAPHVLVEPPAGRNVEGATQD